MIFSNLQSVFIIFKKELLESLRDRKTLLINYGIPFLIYPLLIMFTGEMISTQISKKNESNYKVHIYGNEPQGIVKKVLESKKFENKNISRENSLQLNKI